MTPAIYYLALAALAAASTRPIAAQAPRVVQLNPSTHSIQALVQSSPEGTIFEFSAGIYRNLSIAVKKGDVFVGMPGATLNGSEALHFVPKGAAWTAQSNATAGEAVSPEVPCDPALKNADGSKYRIGCSHSKSLYRDGTPLWRVETIGELGAGKWFFDGQAKVAYISEDPADHTWEMGEMPDAFHGAGQNVTIRGLTIEKYAGPQQHGAIDCQGNNWLIQGNVIQLNHSRGIGFGPCDGIRIIANTIRQNGNLGIGGSRAKNAVVDGNEIGANNYARFDPGWEAGGGKWTRTSDLTVSNNTVSDNLGCGLWSDIDANGTVYSGNYVVNNSNCGILYEISQHARIERNILAANGIATAGGPDPWLWGAQILISTSSDVLVSENVVIVGEYGNGVAIVDQKRADAATLRARNNRVVGNIVTYEGNSGRSGDTSDYDNKTPRNNVFDGNSYLVLGANGTRGHFFWAGSATDWDGFLAAGNEKGGHVDVRR